jgi:hypothetical protein
MSTRALDTEERPRWYATVEEARHGVHPDTLGNLLVTYPGAPTTESEKGPGRCRSVFMPGGRS